MSTETIGLRVKPRELGKHNSRELRKERFVPAVVYGSIDKNLVLAIDERDVVKYSKSKYENSIFTFDTSDSKLKGVQVLMKSVDVHPVSRRPVHVDYFAIDLKQKVRVTVEVRFEGKPKGAQEGGLLQTTTREVEVECLPTDIPEGISIDVSHLELNQSVHVSDLKIPDSIKMMTSEEITLATVHVVAEQELTPATTPEEGEAEGDAAAEKTEKKD